MIVHGGRSKAPSGYNRDPCPCAGVPRNSQHAGGQPPLRIEVIIPERMSQRSSIISSRIQPVPTISHVRHEAVQARGWTRVHHQQQTGAPIETNDAEGSQAGQQSVMTIDITKCIAFLPSKLRRLSSLSVRVSSNLQSTC